MKTTIDYEAVSELKLYTENTSSIYYCHTMPVIENLKRKYSKGNYDSEKAVKAWEYVVESAAKMYHKEFCGSGKWYDVFNKSTRYEVAKILESVYFSEYIADIS